MGMFSMIQPLDDAHKYVKYNGFINPAQEKTRFTPSSPNKL